jgi:hypothetical protein
VTRTVVGGQKSNYGEQRVLFEIGTPGAPGLQLTCSTPQGSWSRLCGIEIVIVLAGGGETLACEKEMQIASTTGKLKSLVRSSLST